MDAWIHSHLPAVLMGVGPKGLLFWQWLALPVVLVVSWYAGLLLSFLTRRLLSTITARTRFTWDEQLVRRLPVPLRLAWGVAAALLLSRGLGLQPGGQAFFDLLVSAVGVAALFGGLFAMVEGFG